MLPQCQRTVDLAHEPPHEPGPVQEVVFVIASDGVHGEYDRLGTLALRPQPLFRLGAIQSNQHLRDKSLKFM